MGSQPGLKRLADSRKVQRGTIGVVEPKSLAIDGDAVGGSLDGVDVEHYLATACRECCNLTASS